MISWRTIIAFIVVLNVSNASANYEVPEAYKAGHNFVATMALTAYFAITDANKLSSDMKEWEVDALTCFHIAWRTLLYSGINYLEGSYIPDHPEMSAATKARIQWTMALTATTASMLTYNSRFKEVVFERYNLLRNFFAAYSEEAASLLAGGALFLRNLAWFYTFPLILKPINGWFFSSLPRQQNVASLAYQVLPSTAVALAVFSATDLVYKHLLVSLKHSAWQFLPTAQTAQIFRFDDCTTCYFGTNLFGKSGFLGSRLFWLREQVVRAVWGEASDEDAKEEL